MNMLHYVFRVAIKYHEFPKSCCLVAHVLSQRSHGNDGQTFKRGNLRTPTGKSRFHTGFAITQLDPARERADIPPGGTRSRTSQRWDEAAD